MISKKAIGSFTYVELLIVVAIVVILIKVVIDNL